MSTVARPGRGSKLQVSTDGGVNFTAIAQLQKFAPAGSEITMLDATHILSPGTFTEPLPGRVASGDFDLSGILNPDDPTILGLGQLHALSILAWFRVLLTGGVEYRFQAYVSRYVPFTVEYSKAIGFSAKLTIAGGIIAPGSAFQPGAFDPAAFQIVTI